LSVTHGRGRDSVTLELEDNGRVFSYRKSFGHETDRIVWAIPLGAVTRLRNKVAQIRLDQFGQESGGRQEGGPLWATVSYNNSWGGIVGLEADSARHREFNELVDWLAQEIIGTLTSHARPATPIWVEATFRSPEQLPESATVEGAEPWPLNRPLHLVLTDNGDKGCQMFSGRDAIDLWAALEPLDSPSQDETYVDAKSRMWNISFRPHFTMTNNYVPRCEDVEVIYV
jgi:hypothetical protein